MFIYFIEQRNKIVHEAYTPKEDFSYSFKEFLECIGKFFLKKELKLPDLNQGNALF